MKQSLKSRQRRQLLLAGLAGAAAPTVGLAGQYLRTPAAPPDAADTPSSAAAETLVVSGRILDTNSKPLSGATVEAWPAHADRKPAITTTDADGRFMFSTTAPLMNSGGVPSLHYRLSHNGRGLSEQQLYFTRESVITGERISQLQRDDNGVWRATFGLTIA